MNSWCPVAKCVQLQQQKCGPLMRLGFPPVAHSYSSSTTIRIYTRRGDSGKSSLYSGERRVKDDLVFHSLGTIDELNSHIGLCRHLSEIAGKPYTKELEKIQCVLQEIGSVVATPRTPIPDKIHHMNRDLMTNSFDRSLTEELELLIDMHTDELQPLKNFILPGLGKQCAAVSGEHRAVSPRSSELPPGRSPGPLSF
ncbi:unnamed protein product [Cyprideis torosa]|uniref:Cobalamin adenosyltransferase-like domain-containing protein n=1 Tax=Cyprideis torosa TaxID=163714 RepID=A0A7R8ZHG1_9CRUS|nr:unnamed protein product [Cyprideis torosa]CAG0882463.1 unnamed protein product [Cyprideis torosa]